MSLARPFKARLKIENRNGVAYLAAATFPGLEKAGLNSIADAATTQQVSERRALIF
jgi:hypothetical protein